MNPCLSLRLSDPSNTRGKNVASLVLRVVLDNSSIVSYGGGREWTRVYRLSYGIDKFNVTSVRYRCK